MLRRLVLSLSSPVAFATAEIERPPLSAAGMVTATDAFLALLSLNLIHNRIVHAARQQTKEIAHIMKAIRVQGWDPVLLICQIISMQTLHYLTLAILLPPLLATFTSPITLTYSGGPTTVSHLMDWREMAGRPTVSPSSVLAAVPGSGEGWHKLSGAWSGGKQIGSVEEGGGGIGEGVKGAGGSAGAEEEMEVWDFGVDDKRGWMIGMGWLLACCVDIVPLYYLIRRPTYILDFSLTLNFVHLILTTYYAKAFPTSLFYWVVHTLGALFMIVVAEQLCIRREMSTELDIQYDHLEAGDVIELDDR